MGRWNALKESKKSLKRMLRRSELRGSDPSRDRKIAQLEKRFKALLSEKEGFKENRKREYLKKVAVSVAKITPSEFFKSREWQELRYKALKVYGVKCMCCGASACEMHVDHIKPRSKFPELSLCFENLQVLCRPCNIGKSNLDETDWRPRANVIELVQ